MENEQIILLMFAAMGFAITVLTGILVTIAHASRKDQKESQKDQKESNKINRADHLIIFEKLTKGKGWFDQMDADIEQNGKDIKVLDKRVDCHDKKFVAIEKDLKYKDIK